MSDMRYEAPRTLAAAVALLAGAKGHARVLAQRIIEPVG